MDVFSTQVEYAACVTFSLFCNPTYLSLRLGLVMNTKP
jgi:hypothetical protein